MGLDVLAYRHAKRIGDWKDVTDEQLDDGRHFHVHNIDDFADRQDGYEDGLYEGEPVRFKGEHARARLGFPGFPAGSYFAYNAFREALSEFACGTDAATVYRNQDAYKDKPFFEMICFADNEGCFGPMTSAELARDFHSHRREAQEHFPDYYWSLYTLFMQAFGDAAGHGFVVWH